MLRRSTIAAMAVAALVSSLTGCHGLSPTAPKPPSASLEAPTIVQDGQLTPASHESQEETNSDLPDTENEDTCLSEDLE